MIPLFPLNVVLCPGEELALHIFEERYKEMIRMCLEETRPFGVILVHDSRMSTIGCTARISDVMKVFDDGRMDIKTVGLQRFNLLSTDRRKSYLQGTVEYFTDEPENSDIALRESVINLHKQLIELAGAPLNPMVYLNSAISFTISHSAGLELPDKQQILEMKSENDRLRFLRNHLSILIEKIIYFEEIKKIVRANGHARYFPPVDFNNLRGTPE